MKKLILWLALAQVLAGCGQKRERIIENPQFDSSNTELFQISKIELPDTVAIFHVDVYNRPNYWIRISSESMLKGEEKTYQLLKSEGFELDKEIYMPESGDMSFKLYFEPIDKNETVVDYLEGTGDNDFYISGIKLYSVKPGGTIQCLLKGEVVNRPQSSRLILLKNGEDARTARVVYIPIRDGKFEYLLDTDAEEEYELIFYEEHLNGAWRPIGFFAEQGPVHFTLFPADEWENNIIGGGVLNTEKQKFNKEITAFLQPLYDALNKKMELLYEEGKYYTEEARKLMEQIDGSDGNDPKRDLLWNEYMKMDKEGRLLTTEAKTVMQESDSISKMFSERKLQYAREHSDLVGYGVLLNNIRMAVEHTKSDNISSMLKIYNDIFKPKYSNHPYTSLIESYINASSVKKGKPFIDFAAKDMEGNNVKLSDHIKGKVALIHLWASWCGPCRKHGKEIIPIYERYKDRGFTVIGVARERNKEAMEAAVDMDKYPWMNLVELNDQQGIWTRYGIGNAGGGEFLVDDKGNFLAVNTNPAEIKNILEELYGDQ